MPTPPSLAVTISHPRYGNFQHWSLHLHTRSTPSSTHPHSQPQDQTQDQHTTYEVDGEHPNFQKATTTSPIPPWHSNTFIESIFIAEIGTPDIPTIQAIVDAARVDNETLQWDCQEYVLEILEACEKEGILGENYDDADYGGYGEAMERLRGMRGPIL